MGSNEKIILVGNKKGRRQQPEILEVNLDLRVFVGEVNPLHFIVGNLRYSTIIKLILKYF